MMGCMTSAAVPSTGEEISAPGGVTAEDPAARRARLAAMAERLAPFAELSELEPQHLRLVHPDERVAASDVVGAALLQAVTTMEVLADIDPTGLDPETLSQWTEGIETLRRMADAAAINAAGHIDRSNPYTSQGFFSARTFLQHRLQLSGVDAHRRLQAARMHHRLPDWAEAETVGAVGVAQTALMARIAANPRIPGHLLHRDSPELLHDAQTLPFADFERNVRMWEALADPDGDRTRNEQRKAARRLDLRPHPDGGDDLSGYLPDAAGAEFAEILAWFTEAEWHTDWAEARHRLGPDHTIVPGDLQRTETQRRADALVAMARAAAANTTPTSGAPRATVNFLIDQDTFETCATGGTPDPSRFRDVVCRTQTGRRLHPDDVVNTALVAHIRRVVHDSSGTVIDLGRRSRLFRGAARDAVMLLATVCAWLGCDRPVHWCDADHSTGWKAHGATVPRNGAPLCRAHNLLKEMGFHVHRDTDGTWHITDPEGNPIR